jgi:capsular polysaccharide biosynthesis protein
VAVSEMLRRILGVRGAVVVICVVLGAVSALMIIGSAGPTYTASSRLVLDVPDPTSEAEAQVIGDTAEAVVTSPSAVKNALAAVGVSRDLVTFAEERISVEPLGSSGVLRLSVTDPDPGVAAGVANELARDLIETRLQSRNAPLSDALAALDQRIELLNVSIEAMNEQLSAATLLDRRDILRQREVFLQRQLLLEQQRAELLAGEVEWPRPAIIDRASRPTEADPSKALPIAALGMLLGLIVGVGVAATLEALRPTVVGREIGRELDAPVLGELRPGQAGNDHVLGVQTRLGLAAEMAHVESIEVMGVGVAPSPEAIEGLKSRDLPPISTVDSDHALSANGRRPGLVLVVRRRLPKSKLEPVHDLQAIADLPLLGILTQRRSWRRSPHATHWEAPVPSAPSPMRQTGGER